MSAITDELAEILRKHSAWLSNEDDGERADLRGADLGGADLRGADLGGADLRGADLGGADLRGADLGGADLRAAELVGANLRAANLRGADLRDANLGGADLRAAELVGAELVGADLILIGQNARGYLFYGYANADNVLEIRAGCRHFVGSAAARAHWEARHLGDPVLRADCLSLIQRAETMAIARCWKLEPEQEGRRD